MSNNFSFADARDAAKISDPVERKLVVGLLKAASNYDSAIDGTYHADHPRRVAELKYWEAVREYDRAANALADYRAGR